EPGEYTYTISKPGYKETTGTITITDRDETITVTLETSISIELSKDTAQVGDTVTASGKTAPNAWVPIKVVDEAQNIIFFDSKKSDASGNYSIDFKIPAGATGTLTVVVGEGTNVATRTLTIEPVTPVTYKLTFAVTPTGAAIVVKDSEGNAKAAEEDGTYKLEPGEYT
ncbi:PEGA domain-containing protein, partial [Sporotomaculum syntrophicum]|uniref:PEGA domain-containing protein n=1 Tax=Sporotomaculum syntrophicum TaxID=182264 RepID=UPI00137959C4